MSRAEFCYGTIEEGQTGILQKKKKKKKTASRGKDSNGRFAIS